MFEVENFDNWTEDIEAGKFGSGASEKIWLINPETNEKGLFKFPKVKSDGTITGEYWAEKLATEIGKLIDIECARVDIGTYKGRIGSMSYNIVKDNEILDEGVTYIQRVYPFYNKKKLVDEYSGKKYSIQMILEAMIPINNLIGREEIFKIVLFDALIGNSDRHHSNWGIIQKEGVLKFENGDIPVALIRLSPLYDNGSSLCAYEDTENIDIFFKDKMKFEALVNTKSKSAIGWKNERPIRHFELIKNIKAEYYDRTKEYAKVIKEKITENSIQNILTEFSDEIISSDMKRLLKRFIIARKNIILDIYNMKDGE